MHKLFVEMIKSVMLNNYNVIPTYSFALNIFYSKYFKGLVSYCHGTRGSRNEETRILTNEVFNETNGGETGTQVRNPNSFDT